MTRASTLEELSPLVRMCREGRLFDVQAWIQNGKPVALPAALVTKASKRNPLRIAMERGFHSLVQVLLEAGAPVAEGHYNGLSHAVDLRRPDLAALMFQHGAKMDDVPMSYVIDMWHPEMVELFLSKGANLTRGDPVAWGLIQKKRPALGLVKRFAAEQPELMRQAEIALRFHAGEGSPKWVALLLWAGADPWARGRDRIDEPQGGSEDEHANAVELAAMSGKVELFTKKLLAPSDVERPDAARLVEPACDAPDSQVLALLLERGVSPTNLPDRGTGAIMRLLNSMSWDFSFSPNVGWSGRTTRQGIDTSRSRERMKMVHMLVAHGAKWMPADKQAIGDARRNLLKMAPDYVLEFVWLMKEYSAAQRRDVQELLRTPSMVRRLGNQQAKATSMLAGIPTELPGDEDAVAR